MRHRRSRRRTWTVAGALLVVAILAVAAVIVWPRLTGSDGAGSSAATTSTTTAGPAPIPDPAVGTAEPRIVPLKPSKKAPTPAGIARQLAKPLANKDVADLTGSVSDPVTGATLWEGDPPRRRSPPPA